MARPYRLQAEGCLYHITSRGDDRKKIFLNEADYRKFLEYLKIAKGKFNFYLYAYCLMGNHYHLLIEITQANLSRIMQCFNTAYTVYYNVKRKRCGHLFQGRFKSILVEADSYFAELTRYIHLNPSRAKMASNPAEYRWSSYNAYIHGKDDVFIDIDRARQFLGMDLQQYRKFVEDVKDCSDPFKNVYAGFILGGVKFIKDKLHQIKDEVGSKDFAHKRAIRNLIDPDEILKSVAVFFKIDKEEMRTSISRPMTAKKAAIYLLRQKTGLTNAQIGAMFNMTSAAAGMAAASFAKEIDRDKKLRVAIGRIV
ncbi:MAG: transposase [Candidatus Omnitrophica bacterium]|nr:transposase [Candidatus Omnitrophota bacterium]